MTSKIYEDALGDALESLLSDGCNDLDALAAGLARLDIPAPAGNPAWTAPVLQLELQRLGA